MWMTRSRWARSRSLGWILLVCLLGTHATAEEPEADARPDPAKILEGLAGLAPQPGWTLEKSDDRSPEPEQDRPAGVPAEHLEADEVRFLSRDRETGSVRVEDRQTGDEMLLAEARGFLVSVYPDRAAMVEVALDSAARNNYGYNWSRLPKHDGSKPFYVDVIFSKTPLKK